MTTFNIKIKNIDSTIHDNSKYVILNLCFKGKCHDEKIIIHIKTEFHFVKNLKIKILINMNVMDSKQMIFNFDNNFLVISICQKMKIFIFFHRKKSFIDKTVKTTSQTIISMNKIMTISMQMKNNILKNRNYSFYFKIIRMLKSKKQIFRLCNEFQIDDRSN